MQKSKQKSKNLYNNENLQELDAEQQKLFELSRSHSLSLYDQSHSDIIQEIPRNPSNTTDSKNFPSISILSRGDSAISNPFPLKEDEDDYENM